MAEEAIQDRMFLQCLIVEIVWKYCYLILRQGK